MPASPAIKSLMNRLAGGERLDEEAIRAALMLLSGEDTSEAARAAFLMALRVRGETVQEITGAARHLRAHMRTVTAPAGAIDIVGTGGDGLSTYNVSTCAAIVAAGAGAVVAKHGNRSVSSKSGASDVLAALGVKLDAPLDTVEAAIREAGVGFLWAPMHHPAMKTWAGVRGELGIRSLFNLLGPLANPAGVERMVLGVFDKSWVEPLADVLVNLGTVRAFVVHGADGMDELTTTGETFVAEVADGDVSVFTVTPEDAGLSRSDVGQLVGGDAAANAAALRSVLDGAPGAYRDIVLMNAGAALVVADKAANIREGVARAAHAIDRGHAREALARLVAITNAGPPA